MSETASPIAYRLLIETKPFVDSETVKVEEVEFLGQTDVILFISRNGKGRFAIPKSTIRDLIIEVIPS